MLACLRARVHAPAKIADGGTALRRLRVCVCVCARVHKYVLGACVCVCVFACVLVRACVRACACLLVRCLRVAFGAITRAIVMLVPLLIYLLP